jgi:hypothetical protein
VTLKKINSTYALQMRLQALWLFKNSSFGMVDKAISHTSNHLVSRAQLHQENTRNQNYKNREF